MLAGGAMDAQPAWDVGGAALLVEALRVYARVRWLVLRRGPIESVSILRRGLLDHSTVDHDGLRVLRSLLFGRTVTGVLGYLPTDSRCLMRSLVLTAMLARRGVYSKVVIGVRPAPGFAAHAWVEIDGTPILPGDGATYRRLTEV
jgi:Transglutaminase-like superfamily